jgi:hypothetical protein
MPTFPSYSTDEELGNHKDSMPDPVYRSIEKAFKALFGHPDPKDPKRFIPDCETDGQPYLTERHFINNIKYVIGIECDFFGKMLYLYFANGYDKAKISM